MTDVFHHIPKPEAFLKEASRCLRPGGRIVMIEPWICGWSKLVYGYLHQSSVGNRFFALLLSKLMGNIARTAYVEPKFSGGPITEC
jgi:ubiquinone/menaquinone biosynthesis C-methylase UbiE